MSAPSYQIQILDSALNIITEVNTPYPLDKMGTIIRFSKELSDFGQCTFRISAYDSIFTTYGDLIFPHQNHLRLRRNGAIVWQGAIIENTKRNKTFIEVVAVEYLWYLNKILVNRSSNDPATGTADGVFRIFNSGGMATAVTTIMNETITNIKGANSAHILSTMTLGTIENPNFPPNMTDNLGNALTGGWTFSTNLQLTYDFQSIYYLLKSFGIYSYADFYLDSNLVFNFKKFVGNDRHYDVDFTFGKLNSNIIDYNLPRLGQRMVNNLYGIATDNSGKVLNSPQSDQASISKYGLMQGVAAYADVKDQGILNARAQAELPLVSTPDETNAIIVLDGTSAFPLGLWDVGDIVTIAVTNNGVNFNQIRRIVGYTVMVNSTGKETTTVQSNIPLPFQYGSLTAATG
jgi:hypothetical protein